MDASDRFAFPAMIAQGDTLPTLRIFWAQAIKAIWGFFLSRRDWVLGIFLWYPIWGLRRKASGLVQDLLLASGCERRAGLYSRACTRFPSIVEPFWNHQFL